MKKISQLFDTILFPSVAYLTDRRIGDASCVDGVWADATPEVARTRIG